MTKEVLLAMIIVSFALAVKFWDLFAAFDSTSLCHIYNPYPIQPLVSKFILYKSN